jgi:hypothetical protein
MKPSHIVAFALLGQCFSAQGADKLQIEFDADTLKAFGAQIPLVVETFRTKQEIEVRLVNISPKHLVITKGPHSGSSSYQAADGSTLEEGGWSTLSTPPDFYEHIVLRPKPEQNEKKTFNSWLAFKVDSTNPTAKNYVFESTFSGYFPTIDKYLTFTITGQLELSPEAKEGEQAGTGQPATRPESKSEGSDKPQPESEGRSR